MASWWPISSSPADNLSRKYREEINHCEYRALQANGMHAMGLVHAYQRCIETRRELLSEIALLEKKA